MIFRYLAIGLLTTLLLPAVAPSSQSGGESNGESGGQFSNQLKVHCQGPVEPQLPGRAKTIFLIGGGPAFTTWNLSPVQQHLARRYEVCRWDMRGVGDNRAIAIDPDRPVLDQWLEDMADIMPTQPVILWGQSWGALQSLLFASRYPERIERVVLSNPVDPALDSLDGIEQKRLPHEGIIPPLTLDSIGSAAETRYLFRRKLASYFLDGQLGWQYAQGFTREDANKQLNVKVWDEYRQNPLSALQLQAVAAKVRSVIYCKHDVLMPENQIAYQVLFPASEQLIIERCMHFPWEEQPSTYFQALDRAMP